MAGWTGECDWLCQQQKPTWRRNQEQNKPVKDISYNTVGENCFYRQLNWVERKEIFDNKNKQLSQASYKQEGEAKYHFWKQFVI